MTMPHQRKAAVMNTQRFLLDLSNPRITPRVPKDIRDRARGLLKHYPHDFEMNEASALAPNVFGKVERKWQCPINDPDCTSNCGNYGCGN